MRPCDIKDKRDWDQLFEHALRINEKEIAVQPAYIKITNGPCEMKTPKRTFKAFAEWFLEDQTK